MGHWHGLGEVRRTAIVQDNVMRDSTRQCLKDMYIAAVATVAIAMCMWPADNDMTRTAEFEYSTSLAALKIIHTVFLPLHYTASKPTSHMSKHHPQKQTAAYIAHAMNIKQLTQHIFQARANKIIRHPLVMLERHHATLSYNCVVG